MASNRLDDQEVSVYALQQVLAEPGWMARMTSADIRGLTPLVWGHVSP